MEQDFEKLGVFYLGRPYDLAGKKSKPGWLLYDSKDLVTHAVCVGMTGSGKTGLCISLLEEAAIDGVPAIVIDPKGDLGNLMLTFPELRGQDFLPWVNEDDARKKGLSAEQFAAQQAELWKNGLAAWGEDGDRIRRLKEAADFAIYTPGSNAGIPISILRSFAVPEPAILEDGELLRERVATTATSLLGLLGIEADPIRSREHILLSTILDRSWRDGKDLDLGALIQQIQQPPVTKIGVMDLESFYPSKERFSLAMALNNLLAAPGFSAWMEGEPLDIGRLLHTENGKPRISIISIAHLGDAERMFFVSLLLNQTLGWMRQQPGTTSLRALLYMDEIFGYFPPVANPPSKGPLLTLLKQARAFGLGIVLATQNPVDLDYKGLSNTGTWFLGRLQTERDKARVLEGLEGAAASAGAKFDRQAMEQTLAGLGNRIFLMNNVHEDAPVVFETRWTLSYLRGPITRTQIKQLMAGRAPAAPSAPTPSAATAPTARPASAPATAPTGSASVSKARPVFPPEIRQFFLPLRGQKPASLRYQPFLFGSATVSFSDRKTGVDMTREAHFLTPITTDAIPVDWEKATESDLHPNDLDAEPESGAQFTELPPAAAKVKSYDGWSKEFSGWLFRTQKLDLFRSARLKEVSKPEESERDFRIRLQILGREQRDAAVAKLRQKYAPKVAMLQERLRKAEQAKAREQEQANQQKVSTAISFGATLLGAFLGRKAVSATNISKASTAMKGVGRSMKEGQDVARAQENVQALQTQMQELETQIQEEITAIDAAYDPMHEVLDALPLRPSRTGIAVKLVALAWVPA